MIRSEIRKALGLFQRKWYVLARPLDWPKDFLTSTAKASEMGLRDSFRAVVKPKREPVNAPRPRVNVPAPPTIEKGASSPLPLAKPVLQRPTTIRPSKPAPPKPRVTPEEIRALRDLIRQRYALDIQIWEKRNNTVFQRRLLNEKMKKADAALIDINRCLVDWNYPERFESREQYEKFQEIKHRIETGYKRKWQDEPPWVHIDTGGDPSLGPFETDSRSLSSRPR